MSTQRIIGTVLLFLLLTLVALRGITNHWDVAATTWLQRAAPFPDLPAAIFVFLGDAEVLIPVVALLALWRMRFDPTRARAGLRLAASLVAVSFLAVVLKNLIVHPAPPPPLHRPVFQLGIHLSTPFSFPSGHTVRTTILAGTLLRRTPLLAGIIVVAMMAGLVYLGDHWASDVLGGLCLGWVCVEIMRGMKIV